MAMPPVDDNSSITQVLIGIGGLQTAVAVIDTKLTDALRVSTDHESRIRALERFRFTLIGAGGVTGGLVGYVVNYIGNLHH